MVYQSAPEQQWRSVWLDWASSGIFLSENQHQCNSLPDEWGIAVWNQYCNNAFFPILLLVKGYQWLKERVNSEEGRRQLAKIKELHLLADRLGCTAAQLAIGKTLANNMIVQCRHTETLFILLLSDRRFRLNCFTFVFFFHVWPVLWFCQS